MHDVIRYASFFAYCGAHIHYDYCIVRMLYRLKRQSVRPAILWRSTLLLFGINTLYFGACSAVGLGLLKNFALFWLVFYVEERFLCRVPKQTAWFCTLYITLCTMGCFLLWYGFASIAMQQPLSYFYNVFMPLDYRKIYILSFSYLCAALPIRHFAKEKNAAPLRHLITSMNQMRFMMLSMVALFAYLLFQGILYGSLHSGLAEKLWSLSGCVYISMGFLFALRYAIKLTYFYRLDERNIRLQQQLDRQKQDVSDLIDVADIDTLTQIRNHAAGVKAIHEWMAQGRDFALCLIDLDGLKYVNDYIGHEAGDRYLRTVVEVVGRHCRQDRDLFWRNGGDEFLLAFAGLSDIEAYGRMERIAKQVHQEGEDSGIPMQISFGVETWDKAGDFDALFTIIDAQMYRMKQKHQQQCPQLVRG